MPEAAARQQELREKELLAAVRNSGLRVTLPRRGICRVLARSNEDFLTASSILEQVRSTMGEIDPSTVYRTLDELDRLGVVHQVRWGEHQSKWHVTLDHDHQHLVCESCGKTITVPLAYLAPLFERLGDELGFRPNIHHFAILGLCRDCDDSPTHPHPG